MSETRYMGRVKWFNDHLGYGFVTCIDDSLLQGDDIFVHYKSIACDTFKTLVKGEYISFSIKDMPEKGGVATDVTGVMRGPLLCQASDASGSNAVCNIRGKVIL